MYKAEISISTEQYETDPKRKGKYLTSVDPMSYQYHGVVETIVKAELADLKKELNRRYTLDKAEVYENRIELVYEGEPDYREPKHDRIPFIETMSIALSRVEETELDARVLLNLEVKS